MEIHKEIGNQWIFLTNVTVMYKEEISLIAFHVLCQKNQTFLKQLDELDFKTIVNKLVQDRTTKTDSNKLCKPCLLE